MIPIRSVLAATDFSQQALGAGARAALLAAEHGAELKLVHVLEQEGLASLRDWLAPGRDLRAAITEQAQMQLAAAAGQLRDQGGVQAQPLVRVGQPLQQINAAAADADLLVLGDHGNHAWRDLAIGTTADRLLHTATRPLLVVRKPPVAAYARVLVLADFSAASETAIRAALRLAPRAAIRLLHAYGLPYEGKLRIAGVAEEDVERYRSLERQHATEQLRLMLADIEGSGRVETCVEQGDVRIEFLRAMKEYQPDLVAIGKQGQGFVSDLLLGSVTRMVLAQAQCDVLVVPRGAQDPAG